MSFSTFEVFLALAWSSSEESSEESLDSSLELSAEDELLDENFGLGDSGFGVGFGGGTTAAAASKLFDEDFSDDCKVQNIITQFIKEGLIFSFVHWRF